MRLKIFVSAILISLVTSFSVLALDEKELQLLREVGSAIALSEHCYDNLQGEWAEERVENGKKVYLSHRFWSREGTYYRIDSAFTRETSSEGEPLRQRIIVRPEGFVRLTSTDGGPFTIVDFGSTTEGISRLHPYLFFRANQRGQFAYVKDLLRILLSDDPSPYRIDDVSRRGNTITIRVSADSNAIHYRYSYTVNTELGVCTGSEEIGEKGGQVVSKTKTVKVYRERCVPDLINIESETAEERTVRTFRCISIDETPAEPGIFSLEAQGISPAGVWKRRLVMLAIGVAILGALLLYRKIRR